MTAVLGRACIWLDGGGVKAREEVESYAERSSMISIAPKAKLTKTLLVSQMVI